jgi:TrpR-related protein YerC/YecD
MIKLKHKEQDFYNALLSLETPEDCYAFLQDLCTPAELKAMIERWNVATLLHEGKLSYLDIHQRTGASTTTISRVARFLNKRIKVISEF